MHEGVLEAAGDCEHFVAKGDKGYLEGVQGIPRTPTIPQLRGGRRDPFKHIFLYSDVPEGSMYRRADT